jgi:hypothetical protein
MLLKVEMDCSSSSSSQAAEHAALQNRLEITFDAVT